MTDDDLEPSCHEIFSGSGLGQTTENAFSRPSTGSSAPRWSGGNPPIVGRADQLKDHDQCSAYSSVRTARHVNIQAIPVRSSRIYRITQPGDYQPTASPPLEVTPSSEGHEKKYEHDFLPGGATSN